MSTPPQPRRTPSGLSRVPSRVLSLALTRALRRAGAFGAWQGGRGGWGEVGVVVPVRNRYELELVLAERGAQVTLTVETALARQIPDLLWAATQAGHEVAGRGPVTGLTTLEAASGQAVQNWDAQGLSLRDLRTLNVQGLHPLPLPRPEAEPGQTVRLMPTAWRGARADLLARGYQPRPVRELTGLRAATPRDLLFHGYERLIEDRFTRRAGLIDLTRRADGLLRIAPLNHAPPPLPLPRATPTAELHLHSARLVNLAAHNQRATYRATLRSLKDVAVALRTCPELHGAQAVFAVSLFAGSLEPAGFTLLDLPSLRARWYGLGFRLLRRAYGAARPSSVQIPRMAWMPREAFLARYGEREE